MAQPLLTNDRPSSQTSGDADGIEEEDALLTGQSTGKQAQDARSSSKWREVGLFVWALVATAVVVVMAVVWQHQRSEAGDDGGGDGGGKKK